MEYLLDTSALYPLAKSWRHAYDIVSRSAVLDLTLYEVGNAVWKEYVLGLLANYKKVVENLTQVLQLMTIIRIAPRDIPYIEELALRHKLTFYDASYVYYARKLGLKLLTNDSEILSKASDVALNINDVLKGTQL